MSMSSETLATTKPTAIPTEPSPTAAMRATDTWLALDSRRFHTPRLAGAGWHPGVG
jgi:hypothetical protein